MQGEIKDILMPIRWPWTDMIFSGEKPFEFRHKIGRHWQPGSKLYIYESKANAGAGMVVGDAVIDDILEIPTEAIGPPRFLLRYWAESVAENGDAVLPLLDELGDYELPGYKKGAILRYLGRPNLLRQAMKTGTWIRLDDGGDNPIYPCEKWLTELGLINDWGIYYYQYALKLRDIQKYDKPRSLSEFGMERAPQSWAYVLGGDENG